MVLEMTKGWSSKMQTYTHIRRRGVRAARASCLSELSPRAKNLALTGNMIRLEASAGRRSRHPCVSELVELNASKTSPKPGARTATAPPKVPPM